MWHCFWRSLDDVLLSMVCACMWQSLSLVAGLQWRTSAKEFVSLRADCIRTATNITLCLLSSESAVKGEQKLPITAAMVNITEKIKECVLREIILTETKRN